MGMELYAPPPPNPNRFLRHDQNKCLLSVHLGVCIGVYEAYPQVTCYDYKVALFLALNSFLEFYLPFFTDKVIVFVLALTEWLRPVSFVI